MDLNEEKLNEPTLDVQDNEEKPKEEPQKEEKPKKKTSAQLLREKQELENQIETMKALRLNEKKAYKEFLDAHKAIENAEEMISDVYDFSSDDLVAHRKAWMAGILYIDEASKAGKDYDDQKEFDKLFAKSEDWLEAQLEIRNEKLEKKEMSRREAQHTTTSPKSLIQERINKFIEKKNIKTFL